MKRLEVLIVRKLGLILLSSYNNKMLMDNVKTKDNLLTKEFYELDINNEKKRISNILNNKEIIYLVDPHIKERVNF